MRERVFLFLTIRVYFPFCKAVYKGKGTAIMLGQLQEMPVNSLGKLTAEFLICHKLDPMPGYEAHDMKHTLLGFPASMEGEVRMQYFEFGNGNRSLPVLTVMVFGTIFMPENLRLFYREYLRGKAATDISHVDLKYHAHQSIHQLRTQWSIL